MRRKMDMSFVVSAIFVVDYLWRNEKCFKKRLQLYQVKNRSILQLHEKNIAKKVGLFKTRFSDQMVLFEIIDPVSGRFLFQLQPSADDLSTLPKLEINSYRNPNPVYCPSLNYSFGFLHNNFPIKSLMKTTEEPQPAQKLLDTTSTKVDQKPNTTKLQQPAKLKRKGSFRRSVFSCSYLDARKPQDPFY